MSIAQDTLKVGGRASPLSQAQISEVLQEIRHYHPDIEFQSILVSSTGDKDQKTSLRTLDKTDFFTKEIDDMVLTDQCRVGIHSAKDLPEPLPKGLSLIALTQGLDPSDSLVMRTGESLETLKKGAIIATSSERREEAVSQMRSDLKFIDIRGTIAERLTKLDSHEADGVVVAEAALIRLGLTQLNRLKIPGETTPYQGQLAVLARENDEEMRQLFACIDCRRIKAVLFLGLEAPPASPRVEITHYPIIQIIQNSISNPDIQECLQEFSAFTHLIFTSKKAVEIFFDYFYQSGKNLNHLTNKIILAIGTATTKALQKLDVTVDICSEEESSEGIIKELEKFHLKHAYFLWPHSAISRRVLPNYLIHNNIPFKECSLYDTKPNFSKIKPDLRPFDEIVFTSPSCIDAFLALYRSFPENKLLYCIGPVTHAHLKNILETTTSLTYA